MNRSNNSGGIKVKPMTANGVLNYILSFKQVELRIKRHEHASCRVVVNLSIFGRWQTQTASGCLTRRGC